MSSGKFFDDLSVGDAFETGGQGEGFGAKPGKIPEQNYVNLYVKTF